VKPLERVKQTSPREKALALEVASPEDVPRVELRWRRESSGVTRSHAWPSLTPNFRKWLERWKC